MNHITPGTGDGRFDHLLKKVAGQLLVERTLVGDVVEQIGTGRRPLHDDQETVRSLEPVQDLDHAQHGTTVP